MKVINVSECVQKRAAGLRWEISSLASRLGILLCERDISCLFELGEIYFLFGKSDSPALPDLHGECNGLQRQSSSWHSFERKVLITLHCRYLSEQVIAH
jgi:hypothetical protein